MYKVFVFLYTPFCLPIPAFSVYSMTDIYIYFIAEIYEYQVFVNDMCV
jgi:hypothetical protein